MDVRLPDGRVITNVPDGMTKSQLMARVSKLDAPTGNDAGAMNARAYGFAGGAIPFGNRITSALGAAGAKAVDSFSKNPVLQNKTFGDLYAQAMADTRATQDANSFETLQGNIAGIASTLPLAATKALWGVVPTQGVRGAINAIPKGLSTVGNFVGGSKAAKDASVITKAGSGALRSARGAVVAAPVGAAYAAGEAKPGEMLEQAKFGAGVAAGFGAASPVIMSGAGALAPKVDDGLAEIGKLAQKYNIPISFDQITGSRAVKNLQKISQELPFSGQDSFRDKQLSAFNRALLKTVGRDGDKFSPVTMDIAFIDVGRKFDKLGKGKKFHTQSLQQAISEILEDADQFATKDAINNFKNATKKIWENVDQNGVIAGEKLNTTRSKINMLARKAGSQDTKELLRDLENAVIETLSEGDETLSLAKQQYKNLLALEPLAAKAKGGNISTTQLLNRVNRIYGRQFVRGKAGEIGDLARVGYEILPELGGSDSAQKLLYMGGALGGAQFAPVTTTSALVANRALQSGVNRNQSVVRRALSPKEAQLLLPSGRVSTLLPQQ